MKNDGQHLARIRKHHSGAASGSSTGGMPVVKVVEPEGEAGRLAALKRSGALEPGNQPSLDSITTEAAWLCGTSGALLSFIDEDTEHVRSRVGDAPVVISRKDSLSAPALAQQGVFHLEDASSVERFRNNPLVTGDPKVRFWAAAPIETAGGHRIGVLAVFDHCARKLSGRQQEQLQALARQVPKAIASKPMQVGPRTGPREDPALDLNPQAAGRFLLDGELLHVNPAWTHALGYSNGDMRARNLLDFLHQDDRDQTSEALRDLDRDGEAVGDTSRFLCKDGSAIRMHWRAVRHKQELFIFCHPEQEPTTGPDTETILDAARQEESFDAALTIAGEHMAKRYGWDLFQAWHPDPADTHVECGGSWQDGDRLRPFRDASRSIHLPPGVGLAGRVWSTKAPNWIPDILADPFFVRAPAARKAGINSGMAVPVMMGERVLAVLEFMSSKARAIDEPVQAEMATIADALGQYLGTRRMQEELRQSEAKFKAVTDNAYDAIISTDGRGRILYINQAAERVFGYTADELIGLPASILVPEDQRDEARAIFAPLRDDAQQGERSTVELTGLTKDRRQISVEVSLASWATRDGPAFTGIIRDITERKRVEKALRESNETLQALIHGSPIPIIVLDRSVRVAIWNDASEKLFGWSPDEVMGQLPPIIPDERMEEFRALHQAVLDGDTFKGIETRRRKKDGSLVHVSISLAPLRGQDGESRGVVGVVTDITDRKRSEAAISRLLRQNELLLSSAGEGIVGLDADGNIIFINPAALRMTGFRVEELIGQSMHDMLHHKRPDGESYARSDCPIQASFSDGTVHYVSEEVFWRKDDTPFPVEYTSTPIVEDDQVGGAVVVFQDVTERKRAEDEVQLLQDIALQMGEAEDLDAAFGVAIEEMCKVTGWAWGEAWVPDGRELRFVRGRRGTPDFDRFSGMSQELRLLKGEGVPGRAWETFELVHVRDLSKESHCIRSQQAKELGFQGAVAVPVVSGEDVIAVLTFVMQENRPDDEHYIQILSGVAAQVGSIVARKHAEEELAARAKELARSNQELEQFAYATSHDLQEPLRMISSYMRLLEQRYDDTLDEEGKEFIQYAVDGSLRLQQLIHDLLVYSRVDRKGTPFSSTDLGEIMQQVERHLHTAIADADAKVEWHDLPVVDGDPTQLLQLLQNLVSNAIKFGPAEGAPQVSISATRQNDDWWQIQVQDNGIGIDEEHFERVFQIFQRMHTRREYAGTGIGLAICKKIVERHGGRIWLESQPGVGTTFYFTMPVSAVADEEE